MRNLSRAVIFTLSGLGLILGIAYLTHNSSHRSDPQPTLSASNPNESPVTSPGIKGNLPALNTPAQSGPNGPSTTPAQTAINPTTPSALSATLTTKSVEVPGVQPPTVIKVATPAQPMCYVESFLHKPTPGHSDEEACSKHKNLIKLSHANVNPNHICVRVNGIPVKFTQQNADEVLIGSIAGPKAKITVRYCVGKLLCPEVAKQTCVIPKDEFMDALGGSDAAEETGSQWETSDAAGNTSLNPEVKKELADIDEINDDEGGHRAPASAPIFKDWVIEEDTSACAKQPS